MCRKAKGSSRHIHVKAGKAVAVREGCVGRRQVTEPKSKPKTKTKNLPPSFFLFILMPGQEKCPNCPVVPIQPPNRTMSPGGEN